jgi:hypothetical protein
MPQAFMNTTESFQVTATFRQTGFVQENTRLRQEQEFWSHFRSQSFDTVTHRQDIGVQTSISIHRVQEGEIEPQVCLGALLR